MLTAKNSTIGQIVCQALQAFFGIHRVGQILQRTVQHGDAALGIAKGLTANAPWKIPSARAFVLYINGVGRAVQQTFLNRLTQ